MLGLKVKLWNSKEITTSILKTITLWIAKGTLKYVFEKASLTEFADYLGIINTQIPH